MRKIQYQVNLVENSYRIYRSISMLEVKCSTKVKKSLKTRGMKIFCIINIHYIECRRLKNKEKY